MIMADTTVKVDSTVRDRLAQLAAERGVTIRHLLAELAGATPTRKELQARFEETRRYLEENVLDKPMTDEDLAAGEKFWQDLANGHVPESL